LLDIRRRFDLTGVNAFSVPSPDNKTKVGDGSMMRIMPIRSALLASIAGIAIAMSLSCVSNSASVADVWEQVLGLQLQDEQKCTLAGTLFLREMPKADGVLRSGRARCFDGRQFDFSQSKPNSKFEIRACEPTAC
jgi:hypothetical protein